MTNPTLQTLHVLWNDLGNIPTNDADEIDAPFLDFPAGTPREDIWRWLEAQNPAFVVGEVMQGNRVDQFVIYSPNEAAVSDGAGFWDNDQGWVEGVENATIFTTEERATYTLPISTGSDARWVKLPD